jgi:hypothetical protein
MFEGTIDGVDSEDSIFEDVGMPVFQAGATCGNQRFEEFGVL